MFLLDSGRSRDDVVRISQMLKKLEKRELSLQEREEEIIKKLKILGIRKINSLFEEGFGEMPTKRLT